MTAKRSHQIREEELAPEIAKRIQSYYRILGKVVDVLKSGDVFTTKNLSATGQAWGYTRFARSGDWGIALDVNLDYWSRFADTPFWISFKERVTDPNWSVTDRVLNAARKVGRSFQLKHDSSPYFPIYPAIDAVEDDVIIGIASEVKSILEVMNQG